MLKLYQIATIAAAPLIRLYLLRRRFKGKEDNLRYKERFGITTTPRPNGKLIWIHGASVGESISILSLIEMLAKKYPDANFLMTSGTVTSAKLIASKLPARTIHQYIPVDISSYVNRFLKHWQPDIAIFVESEIWPNLITKTSKICPLVMVNGHISFKSFQNWQKNLSFAKEVFGAYSLCLTQSAIDAEYLQKLGAKNVKISGNIKYDASPLAADEKSLSEITAQIGNRPIWVAASTHKEDGISEEKLIAETHKELKLNYPDILTIIIPRHPTRTEEILTDLSGMNLAISVRSRNDKIEKNTDIYLADTMGELGIFYRLADIAFVGGSLIPRGGHNPLEPAHLNCAIIVGTHTFNFVDITREFIARNAIVIVQDQQELTREVSSLLLDKEKASSLTNNALKLVKEKNGIIAAVIEEISPYINIPSPKGRE